MLVNKGQKHKQITDDNKKKLLITREITKVVGKDERIQNQPSYK